MLNHFRIAQTITELQTVYHVLCWVFFNLPWCLACSPHSLLSCHPAKPALRWPLCKPYLSEDQFSWLTHSRSSTRLAKESAVTIYWNGHICCHFIPCLHDAYFFYYVAWIRYCTYECFDDWKNVPEKKNCAFSAIEPNSPLFLTCCAKCSCTSDQSG